MGRGNRKHALNNSDRRISISQGYSGPIPLPTHLEQYERILPGAADRIISMAEKQAIHRQGIEKAVIHSDVWNSRLGLIFGFIVALCGIFAGFYLIKIDRITEGSVFAGGTIVAMVSVFIYGSIQRRKERQSQGQ